MTDLAANLTAGQITDLRENWIRDKYVAYAVGPPVVALVQLSEYNRSRKANFFSDAQLEAIYDRVVTEWHEELEAVKWEKEQERLGYDDSEATAETVADLTREEAVFRLIRVRCRNAMLDDPGYRASVTVGMKNPSDIEKQWERLNALDIAWVRSRTGRYGSIELERG